MTRPTICRHCGAAVPMFVVVTRGEVIGLVRATTYPALVGVSHNGEFTLKEALAKLERMVTGQDGQDEEVNEEAEYYADLNRGYARDRI